MNTEHTPGPWEINKMTATYKIPIYGPHDTWICSMDAGIDAHTAQANARLIAAAPDLLEACKNLLRQFERFAKITVDQCVLPEYLENVFRKWPEVTNAEGAIAKAEGTK